MLKRFISMFDIPLETANAIHGAANVILVVGAVLVATGTIAAIWSGGIRDRFADERISQNEADTARATAAAAKATERAALLEAEAEKARLETEHLKQQFAWRRLNEKQFKTLVEELSGLDFNIHLSAIATDPEAMLFATDIRRALSAAGYDVHIESSVIFATGPVVGIEIAGPRNDVIKIANAFTAIGLDITGDEQQGDINILVGSKPPPQ
jgi:hypothetical protein